MSLQLSKAKSADKSVESTRQSTLVSAKSVQKPVVSSSQQQSTGYKQTPSSRNNVRTGTSSFDNEFEKDCYKKASQSASKNDETVETVQIMSDEENKEMTRQLEASTYLNINEGLVDGFNKPKSQMSKDLKNVTSMSVDEQDCRRQLMQRDLSVFETMELLDLSVDSEIMKHSMDQLFQQNIVQPPNEIKVWAGVAKGGKDAPTPTRVVEASVIKEIEDGYAKLQASAECKSLLKKHLTKEVVDALKTKSTSMGASLYDVIRSGVQNLDAGVGVYAPDYESYKVFAKLFDPIIQEYHGFPPTASQPPVDLGEKNLKEFAPLDPEGKFIQSTRIRCGRTLSGYPFNPMLQEKDYLEMEKKIKGALETISDKDLKGTYYPLDGMSKDTQDKLIKDHFLFKEGDSHLQAANACRFWPKGRGIFHNNDKNFLIWVNEEDHMRIISMDQGSDVGKVLDRLIRGIKTVEKTAKYARDPRLGGLTFCPTNLGSTIRASVHIKLPKLSAQKDFKKITDDLKLQVRGIHGEHSDSEGGVYDISNKARLGLSEYQAVKQMYDGVKKLIELEKAAA